MERAKEEKEIALPDFILSLPDDARVNISWTREDGRYGAESGYSVKEFKEMAEKAKDPEIWECCGLPKDATMKA